MKLMWTIKGVKNGFPEYITIKKLISTELDKKSWLILPCNFTATYKQTNKQTNNIKWSVNLEVIQYESVLVAAE